MTSTRDQEKRTDSRNYTQHINEQAPPTAPLGLDELLHLLQNERRRAAVRVIGERGACSLRDLSDALAERVDPFNEELTESEHRQRMHISLYQSHIEKLTDNGVLAETGNDQYALGPAGEQFLAALGAVETLMEVRG